ncbi:MAG: hypothetical protein WAL59_18275, partial [Roseiarcus sp.]
DEEFDMSSAIARSQSHTKADNRLFPLVNGPARFLEELSGHGADSSFARLSQKAGAAVDAVADSG